ncbi:MAG: hypothetical protein ACOZQL_31335 [Myxococcota bacterium]
MPRLLRRFTLVFLVFALGLALAAWLAVRVIATRIIEDSARPVREKLVADWDQHGATLAPTVALASSVLAARGAAEPMPVAVACHLSWTGAAAAVQTHRARCDVKDPGLPADVMHQLATLSQAQLTEPALTLPEVDLAWLALVPGHEDWSSPAGTPLEHVDVDPRTGPPPAIWPSVALEQTLAVATTRLVGGARAGDVAAMTEVTSLGFALLSRPLIADQLVGLAVLERARAFADATGASGAPTTEQLAALRTTAIAGSQLWSPWVPAAQRALLAQLPPASRCAAAIEALSTLELGQALVENYPDWARELAAWRPGGCHLELVTRALEARRTVADERFFDAVVRGALLERGSLSESVVRWLFPRSALVRRAALESVLSVSAVRPFAEAPR